MDYLGSVLFIGAGATLATDLWAIARGRLLGVPAPDWGLVGRWFGHMARGRFRHERIAIAEPVRGERVIGLSAHYLIGIAFAGALLAICGLEWARQPTLAPALALGIATVAAPFLLMQPGMGAGIAASRTPRPNSARLQSLVTHAVFGLGLYAAGLVLKLLSGE
ncbi:MAG TPA: DUF2938 domain-containing protein [Burkholderiales bacterium]|nr:DUF2938 domain-containing protein [Burkholderiales bacterium]